MTDGLNDFILFQRLCPRHRTISALFATHSLLAAQALLSSWRGYPLDGLISMLFFAALSLLFFTGDISPTPAYYYVRACTVVCDCRGHYLLSVTATAAALLSAYCDGCSLPLSPPPLCSHSLLRCHKMLLESTQCWAPTSLWL